MSDEKSLLETTLNTRDLGRYQSMISGNQLKTWQILRSDVQNYPSVNDVFLLKKHRILTVLDLRGTNDVKRKPSGFANQDGFLYINIPIDEGSGIPQSTDVVSESYLKIAESPNMPCVFRAIASAPEGVMINCTAGKDRTGVVSAVLLGLCGVSDEDIIRDYMLTKTYNRERFELIHRNFPEIDMNIVIPSERYMKEFLEMFIAKYGNFRDYLTAIGIKKEEIDHIAVKLL
ncbi:MAG: tyrosine-protein phosphatase [Eubacteriales bacterium]|nr:tyrosine-protein phosphatase [Oscillospiraceae bacterium]MBR3184558.1 tyrosine-protein phosphatase [Oscillospiraceae bacterium]MBR6351146.1 tyrosine-protein phosphatase [Bacillota bacterium]MDO4861672.1 tyrosine-protein phosphatase [Eubacteriales bacterium]